MTTTDNHLNNSATYDDALFDVAIVGLGPVGCLGAILLAEAGLGVVAFEKEPDVYTLPRAVNLDGEIIRALQPAGLAEAVDAMMQNLRPGDRAGFTNASREWLFGSESVAFGSNGWQPANMFDQPELEQFLRDQVLAHELITCFIGYEVTEFASNAHEVTLTANNNSESIMAHARYLLACDGAASPIRKALNIGWQDLGYDRDWLVVDVITKPNHTLTNEVLQVCDPDRIHTYVATKDPYRRWEFRLNPGETAEQMLAEETIHKLLDDWTPRDSYSIRRAAVYQFHAATADSWRKNRVFLAGDAAHQTPPFLGQGMNAGMRDVINIAWKLPLVLSGTCSAGLLDTYQAERCAHAHDLVSWAVSLGHLMEHLAEKEACEREGKTIPEPSETVTTSGYGQGREQPPIRAGAVITSQVSDRGETGYHLNQPLLKDTRGQEYRLDELIGAGFAMLHRGPIRLSKESQGIVDQLQIRIVDVSDVIPVRGKFPKSILDGETLLVRPDRLVYGQTNEGFDVDALLADLAQALNLVSVA